MGTVGTGALVGWNSRLVRDETDQYCCAAARGFGSRDRAARLRVALLASSVLTALVMPAVAQDATWLAVPSSGTFNTAANWAPATTPTGTAFFNTSTITALSFSANTTLGGWTFNPGASNYTFTIGSNRSLTFNGAGILVNGGGLTIDNNRNLTFNNASSAGTSAIVNTSAIGNDRNLTSTIRVRPATPLSSTTTT